MEAAGAAFAEHGVDASLEEIARSAHVGIGTLYRHFPTREHLVEVVYRHEVEALCAAADELARELAPDRALAEWMHRFVRYVAAKRGMANSLRRLAETRSDLFAEAVGRVPKALAGLIGAARSAGTIRADVDAADILQALSGLYGAPDTLDWQARSRRLVDVLMDGLRAGADGLSDPRPGGDRPRSRGG